MDLYVPLGTLGTFWNFRYLLDLLVPLRPLGTSWNLQGLKVLTWTHGIDNTHGIDEDSWYIIGTPESHTYKRAECYPYAGFLF